MRTEGGFINFLAHIEPESAKEQSLLSHLQNTAALAAEFAAPFGAEEMAYRSGMMHDLGKYSQAFQQRLRGSSQRVDHSTAGAFEAFKQQAFAAAFCVAGHHGGLPNGGTQADTTDDASLLARIKRGQNGLLEDYSAFRQEVTLPAAKPLALTPSSPFFFTRMLYSCLVDADWLDTEAFMTGKARAPMGEPMPALLQKLESYIAPWWDAKTLLNEKRCHILRSLLDAGVKERGLFSLTVPTGGGKTVASMAFALRHARANGLRRVIYIIPYTSIIEQTQLVFEKIFGAKNVVAHYANVEFPDGENETGQNQRLAAENWDAPIILTTAVQFFESLFANRSSRCRKLHNIANSVLVFDEAQMLPVPYLNPCVWAISQLVKDYGCTAVLCTATQPSLNSRFAEYLPENPPRELCPDVPEMYSFFRRVRYVRAGKLADEALAARLQETSQCLCVVNSRKHAQAIFALLGGGEGNFHLSTTMTPSHRRRMLKEIRRRLANGEPCRVISTSLIEAGVDVDFPVVWRALAGLDSIIQAGGRCNREGRHGAEESLVYIFTPEAKAPMLMQQNISATERVMQRHEDIAAPEAIEKYFRFLYYTLKDAKELDKQQILKKITTEGFPFATVAEAFHLIDTEECTVYIPREGGEVLVAELQTHGPSRQLLRQLGQHAVGVYPYHFRELAQRGAIAVVSENAAILLDTGLYSEETGLALSGGGGQAEFI